MTEEARWRGSSIPSWGLGCTVLEVGRRRERVVWSLLPERCAGREEKKGEGGLRHLGVRGSERKSATGYCHFVSLPDV